MRWAVPAAWWMISIALVTFRKPLGRMLSSAWTTKVSAVSAVAAATGVSLRLLG